MQNSINTFLSAFIVLAVTTSLSMPAQAEATTTSSTRSISYDSKAELDEDTRKTELDKADTNVMQTLEKEGFREESQSRAVYVENTSYQYDDISIYDTWTDLISDFDYDGFYHRFSVTIDADTVYETANVYAQLYLSYEGGPWNYYASSDIYTIYGDSEFDTFTVETELAEGFPAGYYDVRVELYDADDNTWLQTYGPYDDGSLSTLPLEDSVYDDGYYSEGSTSEVYVSGQATGGISMWLVSLLSLIGLIRKAYIAKNEDGN